jgi:hypothetical protein
MNLMLAGGVTIPELHQAVDQKQTKNLQRWTDGYDAKITKCPKCRRAYDDDGVKCYPGNPESDFDILPFCGTYGEFVR